tara:strand:- start:5163 stop:6218 length:1056 start_codon:yes stop_codon:yes gene_type:complete
MNMHIPLRVLQEGEEAAVSSFSPAQDSAVLADNHGRRFSYLRLSITDVCNFRCNYCLPDGYQGTDRSGFLTLEEIRRIAAAFAAMGTRKIRITGGEPSLRKDLPDVIRTLKQTPGIETVALTSNGYRLTQQIRDWADAGLDQLNVSIDSLDPQQFKAITGHDKLQEILDGIQLARELGIRHIKVNAVLLKAWNMNSFQHFFDWLRTTPVTLRFIELMETGDNGEFFAANHVSGDSVKQTLLSRGWTEKPRGPHDGPAQEFSHPDFAGDIGLIMPYSKDFCSSCNRLRITAQGKLHLCLFGEQGYELRPLLDEDDTQTLQQHIRTLLGNKKTSHHLEQGETGATRHFAMLGG